MFARGIPLLCTSAVDCGSLPVPRPSDALAEGFAHAAMRAMTDDFPFMSASERTSDPEGYRRMQQQRRRALESFLFVEPNQAALERMVDLIDLIAAENSWSAEGKLFDDPFKPSIDLQAAETAALFGWIHRRHGQKLSEISPRIPITMLSEVRRRLLSPVAVHSDYPFMNNSGDCPVLILCDLLLACLLLETLPSRRQGPVKTILRLLDKLSAEQLSLNKPLWQHLADTCALADIARIIKRLTRGELDMTQDTPPEGWLDDALIPWISGEYFIEPVKGEMKAPISGMDVFRLGYFCRDKALSALGAQLFRLNERPCFSLTGRVLSLEYERAARDETAPPPKLRRAENESGSIMLSRVDGLLAAITKGCGRRNAGDIVLFADSTPILVDAGGSVVYRSLPAINGLDMLERPFSEIFTERDFAAERDVMSADLTPAYPEGCALAAYQRTLMTMRSDQSVRLVDAFEFIRPAQEISFRFVCAQKPLSLHSCVRLGPVSLSWDGDMSPEIFEINDRAAFPGKCYLLQFTLKNPPARCICGFTFERSGL